MSAPKLTEEQLRRCEENRKRALAIRAKKIEEAARKNEAGRLVPVSATINPPLPSSHFTDKSASTVAIRQRIEESGPSTKVIWATAPTSNGRLLQTSETIKLLPPPSQYLDRSDSTVCSKQHINGNTPCTKLILNTTQSNHGQKVIGTCAMTTRQRFEVEMDYHQPTIEVFKKINSRSYDAVNKRWSFDIKDHDRLISDLKAVPTAVVGVLPKYVYDVFKNAPKNIIIKEEDLSGLDPVLVEAFLPFQKEGVYFGIKNKGRVIIADDMGLGKTIQAIGISAYYMSEWPLLVVTPSSVRYVWEEAFNKWLPSIHSSDINIVNGQKDSPQEGKIVILSYDMLSRRDDDIKKRHFKVIIFDESHFLKNAKSARTKSALNTVKQANRVILLSGTPALSRPIELYMQISLVKPKLFPNYNAFGLRYCNGRQMPWGWDYTGSSNMTELQLILEETILIRRLKSEVITQLPSKQRQMILLDPSQIVVNKTFKAMSQEMTKTSLVGMERRGVLLQYYHITGITKIPAVCKYIEELLEANGKFICFAHHQQVLDAICDLLYQKKCQFIRIDGSTSAMNRKTYCDNFQFTDTCKVAVLSITAANAGINLTAAHLVIFAELFWNPGILTQAEDRAHRIGQQDCVIVRYLVARGTADDYIWPLIQRKLDTLSKAGLNKDNFTDIDMKCTHQSSQKQTTIDNFFEQKNEDEDEEFWQSMCFDSLDEIPEKKFKIS